MIFFYVQVLKTKKGCKVQANLNYSVVWAIFYKSESPEEIGTSCDCDIEK